MRVFEMCCAKGIDGGSDVDPCLLMDIYERIKISEFQPGEDHLTQVMHVEQMLVGKKPVHKHVSSLNLHLNLLGRVLRHN